MATLSETLIPRKFGAILPKKLRVQSCHARDTIERLWQTT